MDSNIDTSKPAQNKTNIITWFISSPPRVVGLILLVLALVLMLSLLVLVSSKKPTSKPETNIPQATPTTQNILSSPLPDPTKDWETLSKIPEFTIKYPKDSKIRLYPQDYPDLAKQVMVKGSFVQIALPKPAEASKSSTLVIEVTPPATGSASPASYERNSINSKTNHVKTNITKPIEILIGGNKGYEYYIESKGFAGFLDFYNATPGKYRVIDFIKEGKQYLIFNSLNQQTEQILNTLTFKSNN